MSAYRVELAVDGMIYVTVQADDEDKAKSAALEMVGDGDYAQAFNVERIDPRERKP